MLRENKKALDFEASQAPGFDPYLFWAYGVPSICNRQAWLLTPQVSSHASSIRRKGGAPRRVPRRSNGNDLPLIGLRPSMKLKQQYIGLVGGLR